MTTLRRCIDGVLNPTRLFQLRALVVSAGCVNADVIEIAIDRDFVRVVVLVPLLLLLLLLLLPLLLLLLLPFLLLSFVGVAVV